MLAAAHSSKPGQKSESLQNEAPGGSPQSIWTNKCYIRSFKHIIDMYSCTSTYRGNLKEFIHMPYDLVIGKWKDFFHAVLCSVMATFPQL